MRIMTVIVLFVLALSVVPARADWIDATIPGADFSVPVTIGTFTYSLPAGSVITGLTLYSPLYSFPTAAEVFALETDFDGIGALSLPIWPPDTEFFMGSDCTHMVPLLTWDGSLDLSIHCWLGTCPSTFKLVAGDYWTLRIDFEPPPTIPVAIDIKPWSNTNRINRLFSWMLVPVAILSTTDVDATHMVNQGSLTFGRTGNEDSLSFCSNRHIDVNHDGLKDLLCFFNIVESGFQCGDTIGILEGNTVDGVSIFGSDSVYVVPCR